MVEDKDYKFQKEYDVFLKKWGFDAQALMCIEEMSELTKAICKYSRLGKDDSPQEVKDNIVEEIADVLNMTEQLAFYFGKDKVDEIRKYKIDRTINRINKK